MSSLPLKPPAGPKNLKKLLEKCTAREAYEILAAQIILANERTRDNLLPSRVQTGSRKITITERGLEKVRTGRYGRVQLPSQEEARYWLQQWREAAMPKEEVAKRKNLVRRKTPEVRE